jgi:hypothetical protein
MSLARSTKNFVISWTNAISGTLTTYCRCFLRIKLLQPTLAHSAFGEQHINTRCLPDQALLELDNLPAITCGLSRIAIAAADAEGAPLLDWNTPDPLHRLKTLNPSDPRAPLANPDPANNGIAEQVPPHGNRGFIPPDPQSLPHARNEPARLVGDPRLREGIAGARLEL